MHRSNVIEYDESIVLRFLKKWHEYDDVYSFIFTPSEKLPFLAGQNARIVIPELPEHVAAHSLSFASAPNDEEVMFSMHTGSRSAFKNALLSRTVGSAVHLVKIKGETILPEDRSRPVVLIAGGIGVTPFRSMLRALRERGIPTPATLVHVARGPYLYESELSALDAVQHRIRRPDIEMTLKKVIETTQGGMYYVAGAPSFLRAIKKILQRNGVSELSVRASQFTGYETYFD